MSSLPTIKKSPTKTSEFERSLNSSECKESQLRPEHEEHGQGVEWTDLARIAFVTLAAAAVWFRLWEPFSRISAAANNVPRGA